MSNAIISAQEISEPVAATVKHDSFELIYFLRSLRIAHAMNYHAWLLHTSACWHPDWVRPFAFDREQIRRIEAYNAAIAARG